MTIIHYKNCLESIKNNRITVDLPCMLMSINYKHFIDGKFE